MTFDEMKTLLNGSLSVYTAKQTDKMRAGTYNYSDHWRDGFVAMLYETIMELSMTDDYYPLDKTGIRRLIFAFDRYTGESVPDVWTWT